MTIEQFLRENIEHRTSYQPTLQEWLITKGTRILAFGVRVFFVVIVLQTLFLGLVMPFFLVSAIQSGEVPEIFWRIKQYGIIFWIAVAIPLVWIYKKIRPPFAVRLERNYRERPQGLVFQPNEYLQAAEALRHWQTVSYQEAISKYPKIVVDLLIIANGLFVDKRKLRRLVSIRAIEGDRPADERDDQEEQRLK